MKLITILIAGFFTFSTFAADSPKAPASVPAKTDAPKTEMKLAKKKADKDAESKEKKNKKPETVKK